MLPLLPASAQEEPTYKREIGVGVGLTNYLGDFNGMVLSGYQPEANLLVRQVYSPYSALKLDLGYAQIKGNSNGIGTYYPDYAKDYYSFSRSMIDLNATYEYNFWPYGTGRDYRGAQRFTPYMFFGLGATMTMGTPETDITLNLPVGFGIKYKVGTRMNLGLEWTAHFTLSDKLDGVADPYHIQSSGIFKNTDCYTSLRLTLTYSISPKCPTCNKDDW